MCSNSLQNILDRLRHVYTLLIMTKSSECSALTCVLKLLEDKRKPAKLFLIFTHYYSSLEMTVHPSLLSSVAGRFQHNRKHSLPIERPDPDKSRGGVGFKAYNQSVKR